MEANSLFVLCFLVAQTTHMDYILAAANLYAQIYGIEGTRDRTAIGKVLQVCVQLPNFTPRSGVKIHTTDQEMENDKGDVGEEGYRLTIERPLFSLTYWLPV